MLERCHANQWRTRMTTPPIRQDHAFAKNLPPTVAEPERELLNAIFAATQEAIQIADTIRSNPGDMHIARKADNSIAGEADTGIQALYQRRLWERFGGSFLGEEEGGTLPDTKNTGLQWIIDPVDGTTNFSAGVVPGGFAAVPLSCTSVALEKDGKPYLAVVRNLDTGLTFFAQAGKGAYVFDGRQCHALTANKELPFDVISQKPAIGFGHLPQGQESALKEAFRKITHERNIGGSTRIFGSAAYELCLVAAGGLSAYASDAYPWDYKAAALIAEESGAALTIHPPAAENGRATVLAAHSDIATQLAEILQREKTLARLGKGGEGSHRSV
jgi:myo-inositol-1(or 4)-monophosphatase